MAVEWFIGFGGCGSHADVKTRFTGGTSAIGYSATGGFANGPCLYFQGDSNGYWTKTVSAAKTKCVGFHINGATTAAYSTGVQAHLLRLTVGGSYIRVFNTTGGLAVYRDASLIGTIGSGTMINTALHHVEIKIFSDASNGTAEIKIDGYTVGSVLTGLNTTGTDITEIAQGALSGTTVKYDNIFCADDWVGTMKEHGMWVTADSSVQFTPSSGANYQCVDDTAQDGDSTYNSDSTAGHKDLFTIGPALPTSGIDVKCMTLVVFARKDDAGALSLDMVLNQDASDYVVATHVLATDYPAVLNSGQYTIMNAMPDTTALDPTKINALLMGYALP